ncbi:hypothetical protein [Thermomonas sp.]|nr:hypothetical protein [Thermomonas sp.]MDI1251664.1 hypothetical protein [Thermomonas sp.]
MSNGLQDATDAMNEGNSMVQSGRIAAARDVRDLQSEARNLFPRRRRP